MLIKCRVFVCIIHSIECAYVNMSEQSVFKILTQWIKIQRPRSKPKSTPHHVHRPGPQPIVSLSISRPLLSYLTSFSPPPPPPPPFLHRRHPKTSPHLYIAEHQPIACASSQQRERSRPQQWRPLPPSTPPRGWDPPPSPPLAADQPPVSEVSSLLFVGSPLVPWDCCVFMWCLFCSCSGEERARGCGGGGGGIGRGAAGGGKDGGAGRRCSCVRRSALWADVLPFATMLCWFHWTALCRVCLCFLLACRRRRIRRRAQPPPSLTGKNSARCNQRSIISSVQKTDRFSSIWAWFGWIVLVLVYCVLRAMLQFWSLDLFRGLGSCYSARLVMQFCNLPFVESWYRG